MIPDSIPFFLSFLGASLVLLVVTERAARRFYAGRVPFRRRIWIAVPMLLLLLGWFLVMTDAVSRSKGPSPDATDLAAIHRQGFLLLYPDVIGMVLIGCGIVTVVLLPVLLVARSPCPRRFGDSYEFTVVAWGAYFLWIGLFFSILVMTTGSPWMHLH